MRGVALYATPLVAYSGEEGALNVTLLVGINRTYAFVLWVGYKAPHPQHKCTKDNGLA
jgi:hypothetical protein